MVVKADAMTPSASSDPTHNNGDNHEKSNVREASPPISPNHDSATYLFNSEIDPRYYRPQPYQLDQATIVHSYSLHNRPMTMRKKIGVRELFGNPFCSFWLNKFNTFNHFQTEVAPVLVHSSDNVLVSAPTGAGKTALFEMAMIRHIISELDLRRRPGGANPAQLPSGRKVVYIAPSKALCDERYEDWSKRIQSLGLGIQCVLMTGDAESGACYLDIKAAHVILTTPEKWDALTRRWNENFYLFASVKLMLIDEIHLLGDPSRGCCLEAVICRMKTIFRASQAVNPTPEALRNSR